MAGRFFAAIKRSVPRRMQARCAHDSTEGTEKASADLAVRPLFLVRFAFL